MQAAPIWKSRLRSFELQIKYAAGNGLPAPNGDTRNWPAMDETRPLRYAGAPIDTAWALLDPKVVRPNEEYTRPYHEVAAATIIRAVHSRAQLYERMVAFWHDHFNVLASDDRRVGCALASYDRDTIRPHALGNFRELLEAVAASPAMLVYLSNANSRAGGDNENYGRELLELHTLGRDAYLNDHYDRWRDVPGAAEGKPAGYIDEDVYEAARAFTGWTVENGQKLDAATELPRTGRFIYVEGWHDGYQKRVLATELPPFAAPMADGRKVLDLAAFHPATARFLCLKLCRTFVSDNPPQSLVDSAAKVWIENAKKPDQIAAVVKHIALSKEFAASRGAKPRIAACARGKLRARHRHRPRANDAAHQPILAMRPAAVRLAHPGWAAYERRILPHSGIFARTLGLGGKARRECVEHRPAQGAAQPQTASRRAPRDAFARWLTRFAGPGASAAPFLAALGMEPGQPLSDEKRLAQIAGLCAAAPQFQMT